MPVSTVMRQLRPGLRDAEALLAAMATQRPQGYRLLAAWHDGRAVALAGYRLQDNLIHGHFLYVDDLVTCETARGQGLGERLLSELREIGRSAACNRLLLDTALSNSLAQRFYFRSGLLATRPPLLHGSLMKPFDLLLLECSPRKDGTSVPPGPPVAVDAPRAHRWRDPPDRAPHRHRAAAADRGGLRRLAAPARRGGPRPLRSSADSVGPAR